MVLGVVDACAARDRRRDAEVLACHKPCEHSALVRESHCGDHALPNRVLEPKEPHAHEPRHVLSEQHLLSCVFVRDADHAQPELGPRVDRLADGPLVLLDRDDLALVVERKGAKPENELRGAFRIQPVLARARVRRARVRAPRL
eukprot:Amastigsp_a1258_11.p5 type:complete len:144 gc:universal Amastigsp_a1258_11:935-1366(+)